jgi:Lipase maturation factor
MHYVDGLWLARMLLQRGLAAIYLVAFISALNQFRPLLGERGLLPVPRFLDRVRFLDAPTVFHLRYSDRFFVAIALSGITLSAAALAGLSEAGPLWLSIAVWLVLWALYLSIVNVGQTFYSFGWESMLVEAGFFVAFLGPTRMQPSFVPILLLRWMLFRVEFGAGLIKLRHDRCWRDLTCLYYHYETQPLPNPLSWHFHRVPKPFHRFGVLFSHFVQLVVPFGLFAPQPIASIAGGLTIFHQLWLVISGNYAWLNWITIVLGLSAFSDSILGHAIPLHAATLVPAPAAYQSATWMLAGLTLGLSVRPVTNLLSREQAMNLNYNSLHLVNTYGAFGSVTRQRYEIVLEGTEDAAISAKTEWKEYGLRGKPGDPRRRPPQVAPYHLRLDWLMWFAALSPAYAEPWLSRLLQSLLAADPDVLRLLRVNPFPGEPPARVRVSLYRYRFTTWRQLRETGAWWERTYARPFR